MSNFNTLEQEMIALGPWSQIITLSNGIKTPGRWDAAAQSQFLLEESPFTISGRVLDAGGNAGGIAINLQDHVEAVDVLELGVKYKRQFDFISKLVDAHKVKFINDSLFTMHTMGHYDCILALGLVYHFRHPQLFLDYCAGVDCQRFIFSTQTTADDKASLTNMSEIPAYAGRGMLGWYPSKKAFTLMLEAAGFSINKAIAVNAAKKQFTNSYYVFCEKANLLPVDLSCISTLSKCGSFWF